MWLENGTKHFETLHTVLSHDVRQSLSVVSNLPENVSNLNSSIMLLFGVNHGFNACLHTE